MKHLYLVILFGLFSVLTLNAQDQHKPLAGTVSYITSQSVYVRFESTASISKGDTLYVMQSEKLTPALIVTQISSISCACTPINALQFHISDVLLTKASKNREIIVENQPQFDQPQVVPTIKIDSIQKQPDNFTEADTNKFSSESQRIQQIRGRISLASYSNFSNTPAGNLQRMRYTVALNAKNINGSRLSGESYISFVYKDNQWNEIRDNVFRGLKIYNLALSYDITDNIKVYGGRKINHKISNMGAVDGIQVEVKSNAVTFGLLAGSRPDYLDYSINTSLFQYGAFIAHEKTIDNRNVQTTIAFVDQRNANFTDRRFAYVQHSNTLLKNVYLFGSAEFDLFRLVNEAQENSPKLSNIYLSLRYKILTNLSVSLSYSARKNIIYYESFKNFTDRLIESETQQGYMVQVNYRPLKMLSIGANAGYRNREDDLRPSKNAYGYINYNRVPLINASMTVSATLLETSFLNGNNYGISLSRDIIKGKLSSNILYRYQDYRFEYSDSGLKQHIGEISFNWNIIKKLSLGLSYEGTLEESYSFNRIYLQLSKRF